MLKIRTALAALLLCAGALSPLAAKTAGDAVTYTLGSEAVLKTLYPDASWLPPEYAKSYTDLATTIQKYTAMSLERDGVKGATVKVTIAPAGPKAMVQLSITPSNAVTKQYAKVHPAFFDAKHAQAALKGVAACKAAPDKKCWDPQPRTGQPWAPFLPLGLAMATQRTVLFLDYPPIPALTSADYLNNFTMCRWSRVMGAAGATNPYQYETLVDSRPIAAPGSGEDALMPDPPTWFNSAKGALYLTPMLQLLSDAPGSATTRPVAIFGTTPRATWAKMVGASKVNVLDVGTTQLGGQARKTAWIATNHPDVTSYNCCPTDKSDSCKDKASGKYSLDLIADEQADFVTACWLQTMGGDKPPTAAAAKQSCQAQWVDKPSAADKQTLCIQAKLDNQNKDARCGSYEDAWNYCAASDGNACATLDCKVVGQQAKLALPPVANRPVGWDQNCNKKF